MKVVGYAKYCFTVEKSSKNRELFAPLLNRGCILDILDVEDSRDEKQGFAVFWLIPRLTQHLFYVPGFSSSSKAGVLMNQKVPNCD